MPYTLIKGTFHIHYPDNARSGPEPDGDTLKFYPFNRSLVENLPRAGRPPKFTQSGITTIRFEGIDALETHFGEFHQHMGLAIAARDRLIELTGFGRVEYFDEDHLKFKVKSVEHHPIDGYLLSNGVDVHGRVIAFAFTGEPSNVDGSSIFVEPTMLDASLNAVMLKEGQAYGAFYLSLPADLRNHLKNIVSDARGASIGLYEHATATTTRSATIDGPHTLQQLVIWPKLFRRLASFFEDGNTNLDGLDAWLRADPQDRDDRLLMPNAELGNMHDMIVVSGNQIHLAHMPEDVVIVPDGYVLPETPTIPGTVVHSGPGDLRIVGALINPAQSPELGHETVTILNTTDAVIDLKNYKIADGNGQLGLEGILASGETKRIKMDNRVRLSNTRDTITILAPDDKIIDQVSYEKRELPDEGHTMVF